MNYIVQSFTVRGKNKDGEINTFFDLTMARRFVERRPCSLIFKASQVSRIEDNRLYLKADDYQPIS